MKQKDVALIIIIVFISAVLSYFISQNVFAPPKNRQQQVKVVQPITANFPQPDSHYFNSSAFDPTKQITISQYNNNNPFSSTSQ